MAESIGHHAVETGELAHRVHREIEQAAQRMLALDALHRAVRLQREVGYDIGARGPALEFGDHELAGAMRHQVEGLAVELHLVARRLAFAFVGFGENIGNRLVDIDAALEMVQAQHVADAWRARSQQRSRVGAHPRSSPVSRERQQRTVRLDCAGDVDGLAVAVVERDQRKRQKRCGSLRRHGKAENGHAAPWLASPCDPIKLKPER